jgi:hypothetical protein
LKIKMSGRRQGQTMHMTDRPSYDRRRQNRTTLKDGRRNARMGTQDTVPDTYTNIDS